MTGLKRFSLSELEDATNNFSEANKVGSSDFGTVYKGVLRNKLVVVIKEFQDPPQFLVGRLCAQLLLASELQSRKADAFSNTARKNSLSGESKNIITVMGYGHELLKKDIRVELHIFIVEEYMLNGNMANIIYGIDVYLVASTTRLALRFQIILGIAQGLHYLHEQNIVHMNVKPANILLDSDMDPKITDFGIAKKLDKAVTRDNNIIGTVGYMPPEYILEGILSMKHDVYSFGVIILETISGMSKGDEPAQHHLSISWAWNVHQCQQMGELFDPSLLKDSHLTEIKRCLKIGMLCTQFEHEDRPTMVSVLDMLNGKKVLPIPKQAEYTKETNLLAAKGASHKDRSRSSGDRMQVRLTYLRMC
ncbi:hypothetical protein BS78_05G233900 [Paspalum vaginatum]|nr:hypothetical protein BS78_05G233900 [Paspalum vaginatum]